MSALEARERAIIAAAQLTEAAAEMLRFNREGPGHPMPFGDVDIIEKLAEGLAIAIEIERECSDDFALKWAGREYAEECERLRSECARFIEGWA